MGHVKESGAYDSFEESEAPLGRRFVTYYFEWWKDVINAALNPEAKGPSEEQNPIVIYEAQAKREEEREELASKRRGELDIKGSNKVWKEIWSGFKKNLRDGKRYKFDFVNSRWRDLEKPEIREMGIAVIEGAPSEPTKEQEIEREKHYRAEAEANGIIDEAGNITLQEGEEEEDWLVIPNRYYYFIPYDWGYLEIAQR